jgi:phytoene dehydrogenase-like protein
MSEGRIVVVGAGIAGLVCALDLQRAGRDVVVVEREGMVGGRVRSRRVDGYTIDHGFQVLFTAYPTLRQYVDVPALAPRRFTPGARLVVGDARPALFGDATRALGDPSLLTATLVGALTGRSLGAADALRVLGLRQLATSLTVEECFAAPWSERSAHVLLRERGLSRQAIERFFVPFYGGILLDPTLRASASVLLFTLKMLAEGDTVVPAHGMWVLPAQIAARLAPGTVRVHTAVARLTRDDDRVTGVQLANGERVRAAHVVLATEAPAAVRLAADIGVRLAAPDGALGSTTVWLAARGPVLPGRAIWLDAHRPRTILHAVTMTDVAPEYAAPDAAHGRHLVAAVAVGEAAELPDDALVGGAIDDVRRMARARGESAPPTLTAVEIRRVPYAQFPQPPGSAAARTPAATSVAGLWRASETAHSSSLEGAARGGRLAATALREASAPASVRH